MPALKEPTRRVCPRCAAKVETTIGEPYCPACGWTRADGVEFD